MARNASGAYTLPSGNPVVTGTNVTSTWGNTTMTDVATEMTDSLSRTGKGGMLAPLKTINGTAGAPVYTFTNFPTSGWYIAGVGDVRMSITGTDRLKVLATGIEVAGNITTTGTTMTLGQSGSTFQISRSTGEQTVQFSGGSGTGVGANLIMYGESHPNAASDFYLRSGTTVFFSWNDDLGQVQLSSGTTPTANLTLTGNSGSEVATFAGSVATTGPVNSNVKLNTKVLEIGDWNMDSTGAIGIAHGLTKTKIRPSVSVLIRADDGDLYGFNADVNATSQTYYSITDTQVFLIRGIGSFFDSTSYDATSFNRGWVTLHYID
jgi:hypothetical protein